MATSRKPTSLGIPAPVKPAPTTPVRRKPPTLELETPQTIDRGLVDRGIALAEGAGNLGGGDTVVSPDPQATTSEDPAPVLANDPAETLDPVDELAAPRWEERSTIAEKSSSKRGILPTPRSGAGSLPGGAFATPALAAPTPVREDSARVLMDFDDSRVGGPTNVDENAVASMPTAINPAAIGTPSPVGMRSLSEGRLVVIGGADRGREFVLTARETSVGRGADNDIILTDIAVSRRHIVLFGDGHRYGVRDLSSGNGTLVNGVRISGDVSVHDGDQLELGNTMIRFEQSDAYSSVGGPPTAPSNVVLGGGLLPLGMLSPQPVPLPGMTPAAAPRLGAPLTAPFVSRGPSGPVPVDQVFASAGGEVPPPAPDLALIPEASSSDFVPIAPHSGVHHPSARATDLLRSQRKILVYAGGGVVAFVLVLWGVVHLASRPSKKGQVVSTEAQTSPALDALLADVDKPEAPPVAAPAVPAAVPPEAPPPATAAAEPEIEITPPPAATKPAPTVAKAKAPPSRPPVRKVALAPRPPAGNLAERNALNLYRSKDFSHASDLLHTAAARESGAAADRLEALARDFAAVGQQLARGDAAATSNPAVAMAAYKQAYALDAKSGKGAHAPYLKAQLGKVLPRAASSFMSAGKFEQARSACDDAEEFGAGNDPVVSKVRGSLEGKARELYTQGTVLAKGKPDDAKALWRRVLKMVPPESPWYTKSYAALNKPSKSSAQDEDE